MVARQRVSDVLSMAESTATYTLLDRPHSVTGRSHNSESRNTEDFLSQKPVVSSCYE